MNDPRVDAFLHALRTDLLGFFPHREADERTREIAGHLQLSILDHATEADPVAAALAEFGDAHGYRTAVEKAPDGLLRRNPEREVVRLAILALLVPIGLDLLMDASSWLTGSDSSTRFLSVPLAALLLLRLTVASTRVRRFLFVPISATTLACFATYAALGGLTRATSDPGGSGTICRGNASARRKGLLRNALPEREERLATIERGLRLFAENRPTLGVGEFRAAAGYLVPTIPESERDVWRGDSRAGRWLLDGMRYEPVADYSEAHRLWTMRGPEILRLARSGVQGERDEIAELDRVVSCPWSVSVAAEREPKSILSLCALVVLLLAHGLGFLCGGIARHLRRRRGYA